MELTSLNETPNTSDSQDSRQTLGEKVQSREENSPENTLRSPSDTI